MPKLKTNKAAKKRFKVTATGKVLFRPAGHRHLMSSKNAKKRRATRKWRQFTADHDARDVHRMVGAHPRTKHNPPPQARKPAAPPAKS